MPKTTNPQPDTETLLSVTAHAARVLTAPARRRAALTYLAQRGINGTALPPEWPLGYAPPGWTRLTDHLLAEGVPQQSLIHAGVARRSSHGNLIDVFRDRVIFPIHDQHGSAVGFIGRDLSGASTAPKYLNTRETPIFSKGTLLYGLHEGTIAGQETSRPVLVEGPLDVLAITTHDRVSLGNQQLLPIAACGTALTPGQAALIATIATNNDHSVVLAMDGDSAGRSAALAAGELLRRAGLTTRVAILPNGTDPAEYLANPVATLRVFDADQALPLLAFQLEQCIADQGDRMQWIEGRLGAARAICSVLAHYPTSDAIGQTKWIADVLGLASTSVAITLADAFRNADVWPPIGTHASDQLRAAVTGKNAALTNPSELVSDTSDSAWSHSITR
jgi:DNA primase